MISILLAWAACAGVFIGIGALILRRCDAAGGLFYSFWVGFGASVATLLVWNFFLPIDLGAAVLLAVIGIGGIWQNRSIVWREFSQLRAGLSWALLPWFALIAYLAFRVAGPCDHYDTGLYGLTAIRWATTYPVVPGLANLYGRLGFNSSIFPIAAALQQVFSKALGFRLVTGLVLCGFWSAIFPSCVRIAWNGLTDPSDWYFAVLTIPAVVWITRGRIVGTATDEPAAAACLLGVGLILADLFSKRFENSPEGLARKITWATLLSLSVSIKASTIVFATLVWIIGFSKSGFFSERIHRAGKVFATVLPPLLILSPWVIRGIVTTGYPFFPSPILGIHVTWRVPRTVAVFYSVWIRAAARKPYVPIAATQGTAWLASWLHRTVRNRGALQGPALMCLGGLVGALATRGKANSVRLGRSTVWLLGAAIVGLIFWFAEAPDLRFAEAPLWCIAAICGSIGITSAASTYRWLRPRLFGVAIAAAVLWCISGFGWQLSYRPSLSSGDFGVLPAPDIVVRKTQSGLPVYVPAHGDQCWDAPLPCTPYFNKTLHLRSRANMRWGFASKGLPDLPPY